MIILCDLEILLGVLDFIVVLTLLPESNIRTILAYFIILITIILVDFRDELKKIKE